MSTLEESRVRGLLLGLAVGEVLGRSGAREPTGVLRHGVVTQLACATADATVRCSVRWLVEDRADPPRELRGAYRRWWRRRSAPDAAPAADDGWLGGVPLLAEDRGPAGSTARALATGTGGGLDSPVTTSSGWHALARALPLATLNVRADGLAAVLGAESAAVTHGPGSWYPAAAASLVAAYAISTGDAEQAVGAGLSSAVVHGVDFATVGVVDDAVRAAREEPGRRDRLRGGAPDSTSASALWGAVYCLLSHPGPGDVPRALRLARQAPFAAPVTTVTGAFLGAVHGADALPRRVVTSLDLAYVLDQLGRDLAREARQNADGTWGAGADVRWRARYPVG
ncbi:ADP-ribosylglycohydrolase family protein [Kineococcus rubinsiae]|uniref:ADP-ribosylglycohydrolase family protein n=1 Tax=Kineococcus rubinsiae TaxID=2609562 RepID=UPI001431CC98|nr:ADP-ribosylglycohydrolase family protein [Kineococcus rubinsiae]